MHAGSVAAFVSLPEPNCFSDSAFPRRHVILTRDISASDESFRSHDDLRKINIRFLGISPHLDVARLARLNLTPSLLNQNNISCPKSTRHNGR